MKNKTKKFGAYLRISKVSGSEEYISVAVRDNDAGIEFLELKVDFKSFAKCITSGSVKCEAEIKGLDKIGKVQEIKRIEFKVKSDKFHDKEKAIEQARKYNNAGWIAEEYFSSQDSFFSKGGENWARTILRRHTAKNEL
tara:strand:+ start:60663 stop:61079 length:417 start_codon:yes stop_codon:yes gene_type:complete